VLERLAVAGLLVVRVVESGEQAVSFGNDQGLGRPADLKHLVVVRSVRRIHWTGAFCRVLPDGAMNGSTRHMISVFEYFWHTPGPSELVPGPAAAATRC